MEIYRTRGAEVERRRMEMGRRTFSRGIRFSRNREGMKNGGDSLELGGKLAGRCEPWHRARRKFSDVRRRDLKRASVVESGGNFL